MIAVFLDETGNFEQTDQSPVNAGLLYAGEELGKEIGCLKEYLENLCKTYRLRYPDGLHGSEIPFAVRQELQEALLGYLAGRGCWSVTGIFKGDFKTPLSNILSDHTASNLYLNMLLRLLENILFYINIADNAKEIHLHVASRVAVVGAKERKRANHYNRLGYSCKKGKDGRLRYYLMDEPAIISALNRFYADKAEVPRAQFTIRVDSIYRDHNVGLMAADLMANWIGRRTRENQDEPDKGISLIWRELKKRGLESFLWAYDDADKHWRYLCECASEAELCDFYGHQYFLSQKSGSFQAYYTLRWQVGNPPFSREQLQECLEMVDESLKADNADYDRMFFILNSLSGELEKNDGAAGPEEIYRLHDLLLRVLNHQGNSAEALICGTNALRALGRMPRSWENIQKELETRNRMSVIETNRFNFQGAADILEEQLILPMEVRNETAAVTFGPVLDPVLGKCKSSLGQNLAFIGQFDQAMESFEEALRHFQGRPFDQAITTSHILQLACAKNDYSLFSRHALDFFPHREFIDNFRLTMEERNPFKLLLLIKGVNVFGDTFSRCPPEVLLPVITEADYGGVFGRTDKHPWELIYRHLAEICFNARQQERGCHFISKALAAGCAEGNLTIRVLHLGTEMIEAARTLRGRKLTQRYKSIITRLLELCGNSEGYFIYSPDNNHSWFYQAVHGHGPRVKTIKKVEGFINRFTFSYC